MMGRKKYKEEPLRLSFADLIDEPRGIKEALRIVRGIIDMIVPGMRNVPIGNSLEEFLWEYRNISIGYILFEETEELSDFPVRSKGNGLEQKVVSFVRNYFSFNGGVRRKVFRQVRNAFNTLHIRLARIVVVGPGSGYNVQSSRLFLEGVIDEKMTIYISLSNQHTYVDTYVDGKNYHSVFYSSTRYIEWCVEHALKETGVLKK